MLPAVLGALVDSDDDSEDDDVASHPLLAHGSFQASASYVYPASSLHQSQDVSAALVWCMLMHAQLHCFNQCRARCSTQLSGINQQLGNSQLEVIA